MFRATRLHWFFEQRIYEHPLINDEPNSPPPLLFITVTLPGGKKNSVAARARVGERSYADWKGSAASARLAKQQFMEDHQSPAPMLYIPVWIDLYLEVRLYSRSPLALASLMQNSPQNRRSGPPRPPASRQEKDQPESQAVNPPPYTLTTGPKPPRLSTHSALMEVIRRGSRTQANLKEANAEATQG